MLRSRRRPRAACWSQSMPPAAPHRPRATSVPALGQGWSAPTAPQPDPIGRTIHPLTRSDENHQLARYEQSVKAAFDRIVPVLRDIAARQHERDFESQAQAMAEAALGFQLPERVLADAWVEQLDMRTLFAWSVFQTYRRYAVEFFSLDPLSQPAEEDFETWLQSCGFHSFDLAPCADGRLAHVVRYALRLPPRQVRRKSFAGAMFDVQESIDRWVETELGRHREARPNSADAPTRYLKAAIYHYSSADPEREGCAAHGSDERRAATAALERLRDFQRAIQNSFCCGASIDLLLLGIDTDTDTLRAHIPGADGTISVDRHLDALQAYRATRELPTAEGEAAITELLAQRAQVEGAGAPTAGMLRLIARLLVNNCSQIDYVRSFHEGRYADIGHRERFIGAGTGFDEIQLRNLTYFAHLQTVEEAASDLDVGIKIFSRLNVERGLPIPVVVRFDYRGDVPGARDRAALRCHRVHGALQARYRELVERGLLHTLLAVRDCSGTGAIEVLGSSLRAPIAGTEAQP